MPDVDSTILPLIQWLTLPRAGDVSDAWGVTVSTATFPLGPQTYFAVATDNDGLTSDAAAAIGEVVDDGGQPDVYESTDTPKAIADAHKKHGPRKTTSQLVIDSTGVTIASLDLEISITHSRPSDLRGYLVREVGGTETGRVELFNHSATLPTTYTNVGFVGESLDANWSLELWDDVRLERGLPDVLREAHAVRTCAGHLTHQPGQSPTQHLVTSVQQHRRRPRWQIPTMVGVLLAAGAFFARSCLS